MVDRGVRRTMVIMVREYPKESEKVVKGSQNQKDV